MVLNGQGSCDERMAKKSHHSESRGFRASMFSNKGVIAMIITLCLNSAFVVVRSECANACNGHGKCTSYDMCICYRNWQAGDCSERENINAYLLVAFSSFYSHWSWIHFHDDNMH